MTLCAVIAAHVMALWALNAGLMHRVIEQVLPITLLASEVEAPVVPPTVARPTPPPTQTPAKPIPRAMAATNPDPPRVESAAPAPTAVATPPAAADGGPTAPATPAAAAVVAVPAAPAAPAPARADPGPAAGPTVQATARLTAAVPSPPKLELPSSDAAYLQNPRPPYPPMSKRLREEGEVIVSVLIGVDGSAQRAELKRSSGYERLDRVAMETALRWRYVPGKRGGVPEAMWVEVPLQFRLDAAVR